MKTTVLRTTAVITRCSQLEQNWTRITKVDRGFSELDIRTTLDSVGVTEVRRETTKRRVNNELIMIVTDRVLLKFSGVPPDSVELAGRTHRVILHAGSPIQCFRCQRLGHIAANCTNSLAYKRCGSTTHIIAECRNNPKCVSCKGAHMSSSLTCPLRVCEIEKLKAFMEKRIIQQLKFSHPTAEVGMVEFPALGSPPTAEIDNHQEPRQTLALPKTYAAVAKPSTGDTTVNTEIRVNLPGPTHMPKATAGRRKTPAGLRGLSHRGHKTRTAKRRSAVPKMALPLESIQSILKVLEHLCPEAAKSLRQLMETLGPLLNMLVSLTSSLGAENSPQINAS